MKKNTLQQTRTVFIFDIGNVLIDFNLHMLQQRIANESQVPYVKIRDNWINHDFIDVETGRLAGPVYFHRYLKFAPLPWTYEDWIHVWMDAYSPNILGQSLFADLKARNFSVCILSNLAEYNKMAIERKFPDFFDKATRSFLSYEMGLHKPDVRIYHAVCQSLKVDPCNCVFLDDSAENVAAARKIGMPAHIFSTEKFSDIVPKIEEELKS